MSRVVDVWSYVNKDGPVPPLHPEAGSCWLWTGPTQPKGYGAFRHTTAHKYIYEMLKGRVPIGFVLDHFVCDTRICVNPDHVHPVPNVENVLRGSGPSAQNARKKFCKNGHPLSGDNMRLEQGRYCGVRRCKLCKKH